MIDHVELIVPDRREAASWYEAALGLKLVTEYEIWADDSHGPLMISDDGGTTKLALFQGEPDGEAERGGWLRVAFRRNAPEFLSFIDSAADRGIMGEAAKPLTRADIVDHGQAYSVYFRDPWRHRLEVTTYEYAAVLDVLTNS